MRCLLLTLALCLAVLPFLTGQPAAPNEDKAVRDAIDAYTAAFNRGRLDDLLTLLAAEVDFIDEDGKRFTGKTSLGEVLKNSMAVLSGRTVKTTISSLRFLRPDIALVDGKADIFAADGSNSTGRFTAVWNKSSGRWLLTSLRDLPGETTTSDANAGQLKQLDWLVGEWSQSDGNFTSTIKGDWVLGRSFLKLDFSVKNKDGEELAVVLVFGWDPIDESIRSWFFDSKGGFGGGSWSRQGNAWSAEWSGVLADGRLASSLNSLRFVDNQGFVFRSVDREIDGVPMGDVEVKFSRKATSK